MLTATDLKKIGTLLDSKLVEYPTKSDLHLALADRPTKEDLKRELANRPTREDLNQALANKLTKEDLKQALTNYPTKSDLKRSQAKFVTKGDLGRMLDKQKKEIVTGVGDFIHDSLVKNVLDVQDERLKRLEQAVL